MTELTREAYLLEMRKRFCPPEMLISETAELNMEYFRPPKPKKVLSLDEEELVAEGLERFGFGEWEKIRLEYFPEADVNEIRVKAMELVGKQNMVEYVGKKLTRAELESERVKNIQIGKETKSLVWTRVVADDRFGVLI